VLGKRSCPNIDSENNNKTEEVAGFATCQPYRLFLNDENHSENNHRGQLAVVAVAASAYLPLYNELEKFTIS
jgi:hypothetical protein